MQVAYLGQKKSVKGGGGVIIFNSKSSPIKSNQLSDMNPHRASLMEGRESKDPIYTAARKQDVLHFIN